MAADPFPIIPSRSEQTLCQFVALFRDCSSHVGLNTVFRWDLRSSNMPRLCNRVRTPSGARTHDGWVVDSTAQLGGARCRTLGPCPLVSEIALSALGAGNGVAISGRAPHSAVARARQTRARDPRQLGSNTDLVRQETGARDVLPPAIAILAANIRAFRMRGCSSASGRWQATRCLSSFSAHSHELCAALRGTAWRALLWMADFRSTAQTAAHSALAHAHSRARRGGLFGQAHHSLLQELESAWDARQASSVDDPLREEPPKSGMGGMGGMCGMAGDSSSDKTGSSSYGVASDAEVIRDFLGRHGHGFAGISVRTEVSMQTHLVFEVDGVRPGYVVHSALDQGPGHVILPAVGHGPGEVTLPPPVWGQTKLCIQLTGRGQETRPIQHLSLGQAGILTQLFYRDRSKMMVQRAGGDHVTILIHLLSTGQARWFTQSSLQARRRSFVSRARPCCSCRARAWARPYCSSSSCQGPGAEVHPAFLQGLRDDIPLGLCQGPGDVVYPAPGHGPCVGFIQLSTRGQALFFTQYLVMGYATISTKFQAKFFIQPWVAGYATILSQLSIRGQTTCFIQVSDAAWAILAWAGRQAQPSRCTDYLGEADMGALIR